MFNNINEDDTKNSSNNMEPNKLQYYLSLNPKEPEHKRGEEVSYKNLNENSVYDINSNNFETTNLNNDNRNYNILGERNPIFKVNIRNIHSGNDKDNIRQIIITNFLNFFIHFINNIVNTKINKYLQFQISYKFKYQIKLEDILESTVEKLLSFATLRTNNEEILNNKIIENCGNLMNSSLNQLFHKNVIDIFKDIYAKDIKNESDKEINLKKYGIEGIFKINENIPTYEKLRDKYKTNVIKINLMDKIVNEMKNPTKKKLFVIKKKNK